MQEILPVIGLQEACNVYEVSLVQILVIARIDVYIVDIVKKYLYGRPRECHNKIRQPFPCTQRKKKVLRTETTKLCVNRSRKTSSLFPNRVINLLKHTFK